MDPFKPFHQHNMMKILKMVTAKEEMNRVCHVILFFRKDMNMVTAKVEFNFRKFN